MNLELLGTYWSWSLGFRSSPTRSVSSSAESFGQNYPEENDGTLDCITMALTAQFNRFGTLLAVGCNDGRIVIWDFLTRGIAKIVQASFCAVFFLQVSTSDR